MESTPEAMVMLRLPSSEKKKGKKRLAYRIVVEEEDGPEGEILKRLPYRVKTQWEPRPG